MYTIGTLFDSPRSTRFDFDKFAIEEGNHRNSTSQQYFSRADKETILQLVDRRAIEYTKKKLILVSCALNYPE